VEGEILHEIAHDNTLKEKRGDRIVSRGMAVFSRTLGLTGACDVVEFIKSPTGITIFGREGLYQPIPVEYKRGKPKENESDMLQLCAQAMCLEEMLLCNIPEAFLYYGTIKRRQRVILDEDLREDVRSTLQQMHDLYDRRYTPKVKTSKSCRACSLREVCIPRLCRNTSAAAYIKKNIAEVNKCENS